MTDDELHAEVARLRSEVAGLRSAVAQVAEQVLGAQFNGLLSFLDTGPSYAPPQYPGLLQDHLPPARPAVPQRDEDDLLPRSGRNPRMWCEQYDSGTWIHGRPHNCPTWARR